MFSAGWCVPTVPTVPTSGARMMQSDVPPAPKHKGKRRIGATDAAGPMAIARKEREARGLELKALGKSYTYIAGELGYYDAAHAQKMIVAELQKVTREPAVALVNLHLERLERLYEKTCEIIDDTDDPELALKAIKECRDNGMDSAKLLGLVKQRVEVEQTQSRESMWEQVSAWFADPTPELEQALGAAGWVKVSEALPAHGEAANDVESE